MRVDDLLARFTLWVGTQRDVRAAALVGSHARGAARAESDVDLLILTTAVEKYFRDSEWAALVGEVVEQRQENWGLVTALRVFYRDGLEVEFNFAPPVWADVPVDAGTRRVVADGMQILFDPHGTLKRLQQAVADAR